MWIINTKVVKYQKETSSSYVACLKHPALQYMTRDETLAVSSTNARYYQVMVRRSLSLGLHAFMLEETTPAIPCSHTLRKGKHALQSLSCYSQI